MKIQDKLTLTNTLIIPKLTTTERNALTAVAGMKIFNTTESREEMYDGSAWVFPFVDAGDIDHDDLTNTHNLTTDIDHDQLTNTHNLTTDIDHDQLTNTHQNVETSASPTFVDVNITGKTTKVSDVITFVDNFKAATKEFTGFDRKEDVICDYNPTTRAITLSVATGTVNCYYRGVLLFSFNSTTPWVSNADGRNVDGVGQHADVYGEYFLRYDGAFKFDTDPWDFSAVQIGFATYRATDKFGVKETHGCEQDSVTHGVLHRNIGTFKVSGGTVTGIVPNSTTAANRRPVIAALTIQDEDLPSIIAQQTGNYNQFDLISTGTAEFTKDQADILKLSTNNPYFNAYNSPIAGQWQQTLMPANSVMSVWAIAIPVCSGTECQKYRIIHVQGQWVTQAAGPSAAQINTAVTSETARQFSEVNLGTLTGLTPEFFPFHRYIVVYTGGNWFIRTSFDLVGSRYQQAQIPAGNYIQSVVTDSTLTGAGTVADPLGVDSIPATSVDIDASGFSGNLDNTVTNTQLLANAVDALEAGGGAGDADTIYLLRGADLVIGDIDLTGANASFDGGGSIVGDLSLDTTANNQILGTQAIYYTSDGGSGQNDYFGFTKNIPIGLRGRDIGFDFLYKTQGAYADNDFRFCIKQKDGALANTITYHSILAATLTNDVASRFTVAEFIASDCTEIEFGWQNTDTSSGIVFIVDNICVNAKPYQYVNQVDFQSYRIQQQGNALSDRTNETQFNLATATIENKGSSIVYAADDSANTRTKFIALRRCEFKCSFSATTVTGGYNTSVWKNGSLVQAGNQAGADNFAGTVSYQTVLDAGEYVTVGVNNDSIRNNVALSVLTFTAAATSEHIQTPMKTGMESWYISQMQNATTDISGEIKLNLAGTIAIRKDASVSTATELQKTSNLLYAVTDTNDTKFYVSKDCRLNITASGYQANQSGAMALYLNGSVLANGHWLGYSSNADYICNGSINISLKKGEYFTIYGSNWTNGAKLFELSILAIASESTFLASLPVDPVCAVYNTNQGQSIPSNSSTILDIEDKVYDTHNMVTVGATWKATCQSGQYGYYYYDISVALDDSSSYLANGEQQTLYAYINTTLIEVDLKYDASNTYRRYRASGVIYMNDSDYLQFKLYQNSGNTIAVSTGAGTRISIYKLGLRR